MDSNGVMNGQITAQKQKTITMTQQKDKMQDAVHMTPVQEEKQKTKGSQMLTSLAKQEEKEAEKTKGKAAPAPPVQAQKHKETFKEKRERKAKEKAEKKAALKEQERQKEEQRKAAWLVEQEQKIQKMDADFEAQGSKYAHKLKPVLKGDTKTSLKKMTTDELDAIVDYTKEIEKESGISYKSMNWILRLKQYIKGGGRKDNRPPAFETRDNYKAVEKALSGMKKSKLSQDMLFRRGADFQSILFLVGADPKLSPEEFKKQLSEYNDGSHMGMDRGFLSTTPYKDGGFLAGFPDGKGGVEYLIQGHAGDEALYVDKFSANKGEAETLFQAGTRFRVVKICPPEENRKVFLERKKFQGTNWKVYLETIPGVKPLRGEDK